MSNNFELVGRRAPVTGGTLGVTQTSLVRSTEPQPGAIVDSTLSRASLSRSAVPAARTRAGRRSPRRPGWRAGGA
jgi:hypothetical protein